MDTRDVEQASSHRNTTLAGEFVALLARRADAIVADIRITTDLVDVTLDAAVVSVTAVQTSRPSVSLAGGIIVTRAFEELEQESRRFSYQ